VPQRDDEIVARSGDVDPNWLSEADASASLYATGRQNDHALGGEAWKHRMPQVLANFVETQAAGFAFGVATSRAQRGEIVIAIDDDRAVELRRASEVGRADERVQREGGRPVTASEVLDELPNPCGFGRNGHGFFGGTGTTDGTAGLAGVFSGVVGELARREVLSDRGSM